METPNLPTKDQYLLVSDSNEIGTQYDSKKLSQETLINLAEDALFKKNLELLSNYLTIDQYGIYKNTLSEQINITKSMFNQVKDIAPENKLRVVDGQVILVYADLIPEGWIPQDYVKQFWDIGSNYTLLDITGCMLRGMTHVQSETTQLVDQDSVGLIEENLPTHMHNSSITSGAKIETIQGDRKDVSDRLGYSSGGTRYDMFYNDSFSTGLDKNELDGVVDKFTPNKVGETSPNEYEEAKVYHNNLPKYCKFYAFEVSRIGKEK